MRRLSRTSCERFIRAQIGRAAFLIGRNRYVASVCRSILQNFPGLKSYIRASMIGRIRSLEPEDTSIAATDNEETRVMYLRLSQDWDTHLRSMKAGHEIAD